MRKESSRLARKRGRKPTPQVLRIPVPPDLYHLPELWLPVSEAAKACGRSLRTVTRWRLAGRISDPKALKLLQAAAYRPLPHARWSGWHIDRDGYLMPPGHRLGILPDQVVLAVWINSRARALEQERDDLRARLAAVEAAGSGTPQPAANDGRQLALRLVR